jgi:hypothetical protein
VWDGYEIPVPRESDIATQRALARDLKRMGSLRQESSFDDQKRLGEEEIRQAKIIEDGVLSMMSTIEDIEADKLRKEEDRKITVRSYPYKLKALTYKERVTLEAQCRVITDTESGAERFDGYAMSDLTFRQCVRDKDGLKLSEEQCDNIPEHVQMVLRRRLDSMRNPPTSLLPFITGSKGTS